MKKKYYSIARLLIIITLIIFVAYVSVFSFPDIEGTTKGSFCYTISYLLRKIDIEVYLYFLMLLCLPISIITAILFKHSGSDDSRSVLVWQMLLVAEIIVFAMWAILFFMLPMIFPE